jgi:hypothetical protein
MGEADGKKTAARCGGFRRPGKGGAIPKASRDLGISKDTVAHAVAAEALPEAVKAAADEAGLGTWCCGTSGAASTACPRFRAPGVWHHIMMQQPPACDLRSATCSDWRGTRTLPVPHVEPLIHSVTVTLLSLVLNTTSSSRFG